MKRKYWIIPLEDLADKPLDGTLSQATETMRRSMDGTQVIVEGYAETAPDWLLSAAGEGMSRDEALLHLALPANGFKADPKALVAHSKFTDEYRAEIDRKSESQRDELREKIAAGDASIEIGEK